MGKEGGCVGWCERMGQGGEHCEMVGCKISLLRVVSHTA